MYGDAHLEIYQVPDPQVPFSGSCPMALMQVSYLSLFALSRLKMQHHSHYIVSNFRSSSSAGKHLLQDAFIYQRQQFTLLNWEVIPLTERKWLRALALRFKPCPLLQAE